MVTCNLSDFMSRVLSFLSHQYKSADFFFFTPTALDINPPASEKERTPFMRFMKWDRHMADIRMCKTRRSLIKSLKAPATPDDPGYSGLFQVILNYLLRGMAIGWGHNNHARVRKHLAQVQTSWLSSKHSKYMFRRENHVSNSFPQLAR